jgi:hypothetical protein
VGPAVGTFCSSLAFRSERVYPVCGGRAERNAERAGGEASGGLDTGRLAGMLARMDWSPLEWLEALSYVVTVVGLPFAIAVFLYEQRRERQGEEEEIYQRLSDEYAAFLKVVLENADLGLMRAKFDETTLTEEQRERRRVLFELLISLFERAYLLVYEEKMKRQTQRLWMSWEDYMRDWCRRRDFRVLLPELLEGEDPDFVEHIKLIAAEEAAKDSAR